jgi:hypothetical protein
VLSERAVLGATLERFAAGEVGPLLVVLGEERLLLRSVERSLLGDRRSFRYRRRLDRRFLDVLGEPLEDRVGILSARRCLGGRWCLNSRRRLSRRSFGSRRRLSSRRCLG